MRQRLDQYVPIPIEEQVVAIYAGVRGFLDGIEVKDVGRYQEALLEDMRENGADILAAIRDEKDLSEDTDAKLKSYLEGFTKSFS